MADNDSVQAKILADGKQDAKDRASRYRTAVTKMSGQNDPMFGRYDQNTKIRAADAYNTYNELVEGGVDPKEAYGIVQSNFLRSLSQQIQFLAPSQLVRDVIQKDIIDYTPEDLRKARKLVIDSDMSLAEIGIELGTLNLIDEHLKDLAARAISAQNENEPETSSSTFSWNPLTWLGGDDDKRVTD